MRLSTEVGIAGSSITIQRVTNPGSIAVVWGVLLVSLVVNLSAVMVLKRNVQLEALEADEREYLDLSRALLQGRYEFQSRRVLGFPLFLAALQWLGCQSLFSLQLASTSIYALAAPIITALLRLRFRVAPLWAGLIGIALVVWPPFVVFGASLYSEVIATTMFALLLFSLAPGTKISADWTTAGDGALKIWPQDVVAGILLGLCMHVRPMYAIYSVFFALTVVLEEQRLMVAIRRVITIAVASAVVFSPWTISMSRHYGQFVPLSTAGGETLAGSYNARILEPHVLAVPDGRNTWVGPGKWIPMEQTGFLALEDYQLDPLELDRLLKSRSHAWIAENPGSAVYLTLRKLTYLWGIYPLWNGPRQTFFGQVPTLIMLAFVFVLGIRNRRTFAWTPRFWILPVFVCCVAIVAWGSWRYRMPGDIGLLVMAGLLLRDEIQKQGRWASTR